MIPEPVDDTYVNMRREDDWKALSNCVPGCSIMLTERLEVQKKTKSGHAYLLNLFEVFDAPDCQTSPSEGDICKYEFQTLLSVN